MRPGRHFVNGRAGSPLPAVFANDSALGRAGSGCPSGSHLPAAFRTFSAANRQLPTANCHQPSGVLAFFASWRFKFRSASCQLPTANCQLPLAFTLIELLVVITIIALLAAVGLPALKGFGKSNAINAADRQMLDDLQFARQRAIAEHTMVYVVFAPTNLQSLVNWANLTTAPLLQQATNILTRQASAYTFYTERNAGDQPGQHSTNYLGSWKNLPDGIFIALSKFSVVTNSVSPFEYRPFPFPTVTNALVLLPYLAFNYLGQLTTNRDNGGEIIPLVRGSMLYNANLSADFIETPPGNSANSMSNHIFIDALTGRSRVEQQQIQ